MKKRYAFILFAFLFMGSIQAQVPAVWQKPADGQVLWQEVTSIGDLIVSTSKALQGINTETGAVVWAQEQFAGIERTNYKEIQGSPFLSVNEGGKSYLLEPIGGRIIFDSEKAGVSDINRRYFLYNTNATLIEGIKSGDNKPIMVMVNMSDGAVRWKIEEDFGRVITVEEISVEELLIVTLFQIYKINSATGETIWKSATSAEAASMESMGGLGSLMQGLVENAAKDINFNLRYYKNPFTDVFYIGSENENKTTSPSGTQSVSYSLSYSAFRLSDGGLLWKAPIEMKGKFGKVAFLDQGLLILPNDGQKTRINLFDYNTAQGKWGKKGRGIKIKGGVYDYMNTPQGLLLLTTSSSRNYLNILNTSDGTLRYEKPAKIKGTAVGIIAIERGILCITSEELNILDVNSGAFVLDKSIITSPNLTAERDGRIYAFDTKARLIKALDKNDGSVQVFEGEKLKFQGKESPNKLELNEAGILLTSDQNLAMYGYSGASLFKKYFKAPREPGLKRALLYAQAIRAAYIGANSYYAAGVLQSAAPSVAEEDVVSGAIVQGLGHAYEELGNQASSFAKESFQRANARFKATANGRDFMMVMSEQDKSIRLLKVNKRSGEVDGYVDLGKDKKPSYVVDDVSAQIYYYNPKEAKMASYKF